MGTNPDRTQDLIVALHREVGEVAARIAHTHDVLLRVERDLRSALEKADARYEELNARMNAADKAAARVSAAVAVALGLLSSIAGSLGSSKLAAWFAKLLD
jgi:hypothetical protein